MYLEESVHKRRWRVSTVLRHLFEHSHGLVCPTAIVFSAGCSRSTVIVDATEIPAEPFHARTPLHSVRMLNPVPGADSPLRHPDQDKLFAVAEVTAFPEDSVPGVPAQGDVRSEIDGNAPQVPPPTVDQADVAPTDGRRSSVGEQQRRREASRIHTERPTSKSANRIAQIATPIAGFRPKTVQAQVGGYDDSLLCRPVSHMCCTGSSV
jgi:hypothetical protein